MFWIALDVALESPGILIFPVLGMFGWAVWLLHLINQPYRLALLPFPPRFFTIPDPSFFLPSLVRSFPYVVLLIFFFFILLWSDRSTHTSKVVILSIPGDSTITSRTSQTAPKPTSPRSPPKPATECLTFGIISCMVGSWRATYAHSLPARIYQVGHTME